MHLLFCGPNTHTRFPNLGKLGNLRMGHRIVLERLAVPCHSPSAIHGMQRLTLAARPLLQHGPLNHVLQFLCGLEQWGLLVTVRLPCSVERRLDSGENREALGLILLGEVFKRGTATGEVL